MDNSSNDKLTPGISRGGRRDSSEMEGHDAQPSTSRQFQDTNEITERLNIPRNFMGRLIGLGGYRIRGLENKYNVKISSKTLERHTVLTLTGTKDLLTPLKCEIFELMDEWDKKDDHGKTDPDDDIIWKVYVPNRFIARLFGPKYELINDIRDAYKLDVNIREKEGATFLTLEGPDEDLLIKAHSDISRVIDDWKIQEEKNNLPQKGNKTSAKVYIPPKFTGRFIGVKGCHIHFLQEKYKVRMRCIQDDGPCYVTLVGHEKYLFPAQSDVAKMIDGWKGEEGGSYHQPRKGNNHQERRMSDEGDQESVMSQRVTGISNDSLSTNYNWRIKASKMTSTKIDIPEKLIGRFIGISGKNINELEEKYQVVISVIPREERSFIKLRGMESSLVRAKSDILKIFEEWSKQKGKYNCNNERKTSCQGAKAKNWRDNSDSSQEDEIANYLDFKEEDEIENSEQEEMIDEIDLFDLEDNGDNGEDGPTTSVEQEIANFLDRFLPSVKTSFVESDDDDYPTPMSDQRFYKDFYPYPKVLSAIIRNGLTKPTPIQTQAWPIIMSGEDVVMKAGIDSGKSLAFVLPALIHIDVRTTTSERNLGPTVLILAPTSQSADKIKEQVRIYCHDKIRWIVIHAESMRNKAIKAQQIKVINTGVDLIIGTPLMFEYLIAEGLVELDTFSYIVLDEVDRMLNMGFESQIHKVLGRARKENRQTIITSGTWFPGVRKIVRNFMAPTVNICNGNLKFPGDDIVTQEIYLLEPRFKLNFFRNFIQNLERNSKVIVFVEKSLMLQFLTSEISRKGISCSAIHDKLTKEDMRQIVEDLMKGNYKVIVATVVPSREIDLANLTHVLNYDFPRDCKEYVHRIERTASSKNLQMVLSYFTYTDDRSQVKELISYLKSTKQEVPEELLQLISGPDGDRTGRLLRGRPIF